MCTRIQRRLGASPLSHVRRESWSSPPVARAAATSPRDFAHAAAHLARTSSGGIVNASFHSQSGSAAKSAPLHVSARSLSCRKHENQWSSTHDMWLSSPARVIVDLAVRSTMPAASTPRHFHSSVARW